MDNKASCRHLLKKLKRQYKQSWNYGKKLWKTERNTLFTGSLLVLLVILLLGICSQYQLPAAFTNASANGVPVSDYSTFVKQVRAGNVVAVTIQGNTVMGLLANPHAQKDTPLSEKDVYLEYIAWVHDVGTSSRRSSAFPVNFNRAIYTHAPMGGDAQLMPLLLSHKIIINTLPINQSSVWLAMLWKFASMVLLVILLLIFFFSYYGVWLSRQKDDRVSQTEERRRFDTRVKRSKVGKSLTSGPAVKPPEVSVEPPVTFADVAGIDEVRAELEEIVQFLRSPQCFNRLGAHMPRGALLAGPPGTGKTLLAKAVAGEANVPFFSISASEFVEMFVGVGASRVRDLFDQAKQAAPCVIFIDELDAVGRKRSAGAANNHEYTQTLNQLLVELDGFDARQAVVVLAATNRVDILDKALLRPGRFDRRITISLPDRVGREAILRVHTRNTPLSLNVCLEHVSRMTTGMSGADLANLVNEAALSAARQDLPYVTRDCFEEALARVQLGALRPLVLSEKERRVVAIHEGGHALVAYHLPEADTVNGVTILPRGQSLGVTQFIAEEDRYNYSREALMARIAVGLGGRVAEEITLGPNRIMTGAENDLQGVTNLARCMVTRWGMSEQVGLVFADQHEYAFSIPYHDDIVQARSLVVDTSGRLMLNGGEDSTCHQSCTIAVSHTTTSITMNALIDAEVQCILNEGHAMAHAVLTEHCDQLALLADTLMVYEQLNRAQFEALCSLPLPLDW